ncbi:MAG: SAF domain-containing protein [Actinomycetota bacterium]
MRAPARPSPSPLSSPSVAFGTVRLIVRRRRLGPVLIALVVGLAVLGVVRDAESTRRAAAARWDATTPVWTTLEPVPAGEPIDPAIVERVTVPAALVPDDAVVDDPTGRRTRTDLSAGEILVGHRLADSVSAAGAQTPPGWRTISIARRDDLFVVGDLLDLHHAIDGRRITADALVVVASDADLGVAVPADAVDAIVRAIGQAGVVPVLRG